MTPRERLLKVLGGGIPDCVPVAPEFSNMIPARLTGKPFWDLYLYNGPADMEGIYRRRQAFRYRRSNGRIFPLPVAQRGGG
ncbi:MAG: hypothetical protein SVV80_10845 [Planctomycetota bacterium]|nr:hypothetical protein [Planctomycetota bacterium]